MVEAESIAKPQKAMRTYSESQKSQKTVKSMIETKSGDKSKDSTSKKNKHNKKEGEVFICHYAVQKNYITCNVNSDL